MNDDEWVFIDFNPDLSASGVNAICYPMHEYMLLPYVATFLKVETVHCIVKKEHKP